MKFEIMIKILFTLLARRKVTAGYLAGKYGISVRSVYRYVDEMTCAGIPLDVVRGAGGGVRLSEAYMLHSGMFTREEYRCAIDSLLAMKEQLGDPLLSDVIEKLKFSSKAPGVDTSVAGNLLVDGGNWGEEQKFSELLSLVSRATAERQTLEIDYTDRGGERSQRVILPHLLVLKQNIWYVYAYCTTRNAFRLFKVGRIRSVHRTGETFEAIPYNREDIPLKFWHDGQRVDAKFEISPECLPFAEEWLGVQSVYEKEGKYFAEVTLPDDESLVGKILSAGAGLKVLSPDALAERVKTEVENLARAYCG